MASNNVLEFAQNEKGEKIGLRLGMANRHGLVAGATGTGKTVTLQTLTELFSRSGVPVFLADIKGDLSGIAKAGVSSPKLEERIKKLQLPTYQGEACPALIWDVFGKKGHALRATISEMGPVLLSRLLDLSDTQADVLEVSFKIADDQGLLLLDLKDLKSLLQWVGENAEELRKEYGNIAPQTIGAIQRGLVSLGQAGGEEFFGEPAIELKHLMQSDFSGRGVVSILDATSLISDGRVYSTFLLWLLSELFENLPEVGDIEKPKLVFFFDEAHLLFKDTPKSLVDKIEQVVRLVRSKGVGVYFVTQNPLDLPEAVLGQLGNRVQHALRAFTPSDQKAVRVAAQTFRANPGFSCEEAICNLSVGEALISTLDEKGAPTVVERAWVYPPHSRMGTLSDDERKDILDRSPLKDIYGVSVDRESAYELLKKRKEGDGSTSTEKTGSGAPEKPEEPSWVSSTISNVLWGTGKRQGMVESAAKSFIRSVSSSLGRQVLRGVLGTITSNKRR